LEFIPISAPRKSVRKAIVDGSVDQTHVSEKLPAARFSTRLGSPRGVSRAHPSSGSGIANVTNTLGTLNERDAT
jgi:hypothetical protein